LKIYATVEGVEKAIADLSEFTTESQKKLRELIGDKGDLIASAGRILAPVATGKTKESIDKMVGHRALAAWIRPERSKRLNYAADVEYGTSSLGATNAGSTRLYHRVPHRPIPSPKKLKSWAESKGLNPFAVARNIYKRGGIKPRLYMERAAAMHGPGFVAGVERILEEQARDFNAKR
jgi:hypothetical protein